MDDLHLATPRDLHILNVGYAKGYEFALAQISGTGLTSAAPSSPRFDSPSGPSPEGAPPHGSIEPGTQSSPAQRESVSESDFSWGSDDELLREFARALGLPADEVEPLIKDGEFTSGFEGWGTTPEGEDLNEVDDTYANGYADGFVGGLQAAISIGESHPEEPTANHLLNDYAEAIKLWRQQVAELNAETSADPEPF